MRRLFVVGRQYMKETKHGRELQNNFMDAVEQLIQQGAKKHKM